MPSARLEPAISRLSYRVVAQALGFFVAAAIAAAADNPKSMDFAGWVTAVDPRARTIEVKGKKTFVFTVDRKCRVARGGNWWNQPGAQLGTLSSVKVGDAVIGKLSLAGPQPTVVSLEATPDPKTGIPQPKKPGFIRSPYPSGSGLSIDVRGLPRGTIVEDPSTGKLMLVP